MNYSATLNQTKENYPFEKWHAMEARGLDQYTAENCAAATQIFDALIANLIDLGENATEEAKVQKFEVAVEALNELDAETGMIETDEREQLCDLINVITEAAGINASKYGDGEGLASEWRDW